MSEIAIWGGSIGGAISTVVWAMKKGGAWDRIPKWLRPLLFVGLAGVGAACAALGGGATVQAAILAGLAGLTAARAGYETVAGVKEEAEISRVADSIGTAKSVARKASRLAKKIVEDRL